MDVLSLPTTVSTASTLSTMSPLAGGARECARSLIWSPGAKQSRHFAERAQAVGDRLERILNGLERAANKSGKVKGSAFFGDAEWLYDNRGLLRSVAQELRNAAQSLSSLPNVRCPHGQIAPRILALGEDLAQAVDYRFSDSAFSLYVAEFQAVTVLTLEELSLLPIAIKLVLLEAVAAGQAAQTPDAANSSVPGRVQTQIERCVRSLWEIRDTCWNEVLEPLIVFDQLLRGDPAQAYERMDAESRELYRRTVQFLARHSDLSETDIAGMAVSLARESRRQPETDPRRAARRAHVGYYLLAEGRFELYRLADVRLPVHDRIEEWLRRHADEFYLPGVEVLTLLITLAVLWPIEFPSLWAAFLAFFALLLPASQGAVEVMNYLTTTLLRPRPLPKLDFHNAIPEECVTMVAVPSLLLNPRQVRRLVHDLEVRYAGNSAANIYFALLTDLSDAAEQPAEDDPLVTLCSELIRGLNEKYSRDGGRRFFLFHRHRTYNPREGVWMGWERKRGKLLDFNRLILGEYDNFPVKVGDLTVLGRVRYVLTVDSDTELPRGCVQRLAGAIAHPLCQAVIDPQSNIVTEGYGILQPRVGVSVQSAAQSRLASIYSGQTGLDIYTHATSDVYQDLYGEGSFTGKGLYEVRILRDVLEHRFPRNALLSHDLIEGAYTRAGLVSDIEVVDHYPSHYSAYTRRKHRWLRGDWQIVEWLFAQVPNERGQRVPNPTSLISRWKIFDNLRRSVVEPATLLLLLLGWTALAGGPLYWTLITLALFFVPPWVQIAVRLLSELARAHWRRAAGAFRGLGATLAGIALALAFLVHNSLVATDAIWRTWYRRMVSRQKLLEWETAAESELRSGQKKRPVDLYLNWTPALAGLVGLWLFVANRSALRVSLPLLALWALSRPLAWWLDRPAVLLQQRISRKDENFLRGVALRTWRYFAEYSNEEHHWLIPDNVQEDPPMMISRTTPTNIGFLLNARQAACEFGYLTLPEFTANTLRTLETLSQLRLYRGHLLNWYDTRTLAPLPPRFVSSVDSGNLAASLLALEHGAKALLERPLLSPALAAACGDHVLMLDDLRALPRKFARAWRKAGKLLWHRRLLALLEWPDTMPPPPANITGKKGEDARWFAAQLLARKHAIRDLITAYLPWLAGEFDHLFGAMASLSPPLRKSAMREHRWLRAARVPLRRLPAFIEGLEAGVERHRPADDSERRDRNQLLAALREARARTLQLVGELRQIAVGAEQMFAAMDFGFLLDRRRKLLSIGYDVDANTLHNSAYDLLASEARLASFLAISKGEVPQESWFRLGRMQVKATPSPVLLSWTGTMFEYLMPALWMWSYPGTLLHRTMNAAVAVQQSYAASAGVPWGISESGFCEVDSSGLYQYRAFGVPQLALQNDSRAHERLVVAPYATALALAADEPAPAVRNLQRMAENGWYGACGFYEAAELIPRPAYFRRRRFDLVRSWMAHHQGMTLLSLANYMGNGVFRQWFHADVRVQATELLLQERPVFRHLGGAQPAARSISPTGPGRPGAKARKSAFMPASVDLPLAS